MNISISLRDVSLIILGGFITFIAQFFANKLSKAKPKLIWRKFPFIKFKDGTISACWIVENIGNAPAEEVKIGIEVGQNGILNDISVFPSETAIDYSIKKEKSKGNILIPFLNEASSISISASISNLENENINISIVSKNVKGIEAKESIIARKLDKYYPKITIAYFVFIIIIFGALVLAGILSIYDTFHEVQVEHLAGLHIKLKDYDGAIDIYKNFLNKTLLYNNKGIILYKIAKLYALKGDQKSCLVYLNKAFTKSPSLKEIALKDEILRNIMKLQTSNKPLQRTGVTAGR